MIWSVNLLWKHKLEFHSLNLNTICDVLYKFRFLFRALCTILMEAY